MKIKDIAEKLKTLATPINAILTDQEGDESIALIMVAYDTGIFYICFDGISFELPFELQVSFVDFDGSFFFEYGESYSLLILKPALM